jgi:hypothetical protein
MTDAEILTALRSPMTAAELFEDLGCESDDKATEAWQALVRLEGAGKVQLRVHSVARIREWVAA